MNTKNTVVQQLLAKRNAERAKWQPTQEQKEAMIAQEPSEGQVAKLIRYGLSNDEITAMTRWDASEYIEKEEARRGTPGSLSKNQEKALLNCGYYPDDIKVLSFYEASELLEATFAGKPRR